VHKAPTIRFAATLVVVVCAVIASAAVAVVALTRVPGAAGLGALAWLLPLATVMVVCGVALLLLGDGSRRRAGGSVGPLVKDCPACGHEVGGGWRLCPWCGDRLAGRRRDRAA